MNNKSSKPRRTAATDMYGGMLYLSRLREAADAAIKQSRRYREATCENIALLLRLKMPLLLLADDQTIYGLCVQHAFNRVFADTDAGKLNLRTATQMDIRALACFEPDTTNTSDIYKLLVKLWKARLAQICDYIIMICVQHQSLRPTLDGVRLAIQDGAE